MREQELGQKRSKLSTQVPRLASVRRCLGSSLRPDDVCGPLHV